MLDRMLNEMRRRAEARTWQPRPELLLQPNIPKPMHGLAPRVILGRDWWDRVRQEAFKKTDWHCAACGVLKTIAAWHPWLEGHELYNIDYVTGQMTYVETVGLCHSCHSYIHDGRLQALFDDGEITEEKYRAILVHGRQVLKAAGMKKRPPDPKMSCAPWGDWRLVIDLPELGGRREFAPLYKDFDDWRRAYGSNSA